MDMTLQHGERQVAPRLSGIRADHVARYRWAASKIKAGSRVVDFACGVGYGTHLLASAGFEVTGYDNAQDALDFAQEHYPKGRYEFADSVCPAPHFDVAVCFETIEHLEHPAALLSSFDCRLLLVSVPNQAVIPYRPDRFPFHYRHYTKQEFVDLLNGCGWSVVEWWGQKNKWKGQVARNLVGRTLIAVAQRLDA